MWVKIFMMLSLASIIDAYIICNGTKYDSYTTKEIINIPEHDFLRAWFCNLPYDRKKILGLYNWLNCTYDVMGNDKIFKNVRRKYSLREKDLMSVTNISKFIYYEYSFDNCTSLLNYRSIYNTTITEYDKRQDIFVTNNTFKLDKRNLRFFATSTQNYHITVQQYQFIQYFTAGNFYQYVWLLDNVFFSEPSSIRACWSPVSIGALPTCEELAVSPDSLLDRTVDNVTYYLAHPTWWVIVLSVLAILLLIMVVVKIEKLTGIINGLRYLFLNILIVFKNSFMIIITITGIKKMFLSLYRKAFKSLYLKGLMTTGMRENYESDDFDILEDGQNRVLVDGQFRNFKSNMVNLEGLVLDIRDVSEINKQKKPMEVKDKLGRSYQLIRRDNKWLRILMISLLISFILAEGRYTCDYSVIVESSFEACQVDVNNVQTCSMRSVDTIDVPSTGTVCINFKNGTKTGHMRIEQGYSFINMPGSSYLYSTWGVDMKTRSIDDCSNLFSTSYSCREGRDIARNQHYIGNQPPFYREWPGLAGCLGESVCGACKSFYHHGCYCWETRFLPQDRFIEVHQAFAHHISGYIHVSFDSYNSSVNLPAQASTCSYRTGQSTSCNSMIIDDITNHYETYISEVLGEHILIEKISGAYMYTVVPKLMTVSNLDDPRPNSVGWFQAILTIDNRRLGQYPSRYMVNQDTINVTCPEDKLFNFEVNDVIAKSNTIYDQLLRGQFNYGGFAFQSNPGHAIVLMPKTITRRLRITFNNRVYIKESYQVACPVIRYSKISGSYGMVSMAAICLGIFSSSLSGDVAIEVRANTTLIKSIHIEIETSLEEKCFHLTADRADEKYNITAYTVQCTSTSEVMGDLKAFIVADHVRNLHEQQSGIGETKEEPNTFFDRLLDHVKDLFSFSGSLKEILFKIFLVVILIISLFLTVSIAIKTIPKIFRSTKNFVKKRK